LVKILDDAVADIRDHGVTDDELGQAKTQIRQRPKITSRQTCTDIATQLGEGAPLRRRRRTRQHRSWEN